MVEIHGWLTIRETFRADLEEEEQLGSLIEIIRREIDKLKWFKPEIKFQNGEAYIEFSLFCNHINSEVSEIFKLVKYIGETADGSYGLIYLYNDEDRNGKENQFQVFLLARGKIEEKTDPFLSPIIPTIEDKDELLISGG